MKKIALIGFIGFLLALFSVLPAQAAEPIKFGFLHSLSGGVGQVYGIPDQAGVKIAVDEINKAGGILGRPLEMISRDDKLSPETGVREAKDLILNQKVHWIQGTVSSAVALAVSAYCKGQKVIFVDTVAQSAATTGEKGHRYVFRVCTNTTTYSRSVANAAAKYWGGKKVFIIGPDYEYGHRCKSDFMDAYTKLVPDAKVVGELWPKLGNQDWTPYISKIMASDADFVYCSLWGGDVLSFTKAATAFGYFDRVKHCGQDWGSMEALSKMTKQSYDKGALGGSHYPWWIIDNPISNAYYPKFKKVTGMDAGLAAASGYTTVYAMKAAIEKAGSLNTEKMVDALEGMVVNSVVGPVKIRACDHQAMWPFWVGKVVFNDKHPWPYISDPIALEPPEKGYRTCEEIEAARKATK
ncbi:MAG: ABC transporter substrate-binding protein [Desulfobacteraceae bacterium]|nr:ABC transporter substrate-binding protein [Desulfobacteraceae bacterium]